MWQATLLGERGRSGRARHHRFDHHVAGVERIGPARVLVHHLREQLLVEAPPVHPDPHGLAVGEGDVDDRAEVLVAPLGADVSGIDAVLGEGGGTRGVFRQQQVAVVVEVADDRHVHLGHDGGHGLRGGVVVDRDPHQLASRLMQGPHLRRGGVHVRGVGVGHRLDDDRVRAAHLHTRDVHDRRLPALISAAHAPNIRPVTRGGARRACR